MVALTRLGGSLATLLLLAAPVREDEGVLTKAERLIHATGSAEAVSLENARKTKAEIFKAAGKDGRFTFDGLNP